ncbi:PREDICTED: uncharacterized protein LOC108564841 [Nicrophorus vespilloides]|uniref:Uncharacterized protein LOC108564841 n=1 Tax=Nicrophorus vespilloides TaxID=110193 RepID=A0ABM1MY38_NICVS|nr:PREDICTED: uncharacterized protein LOC108564841 [Nicrophorus vespilloides]
MDPNSGPSQVIFDEVLYQPAPPSVQLQMQQQHVDLLMNSEEDFSDSDFEVDIVVDSDHDSRSEQSEDDDVPTAVSSEEGYYSNTQWSEEQPVVVTKPHIDFELKLPGLRPPAKELGLYIEPITAWEFIFGDAMLKNIILYTNRKLAKTRKKSMNPNRTELRECCEFEVRAFLGLLLYSGVFRSNHENISALFATDGTGRDIFRAVLSAKRFQVLLLCLRFDNCEDREQRKLMDKGTAVSELIKSFNDNSQAVFSIGSCANIDEMLIECSGPCSFRMYMANRGDKYGLKMQCLTDARNNYAYNVYLYTGKGSDGFGLNADEKLYSAPTQAAIRLCKPIIGTDINVTTDTWYTSMELVEVLKVYGLTCVGTLKKHSPDIPTQFLPSRSRSVGSAIYSANKDTVIVSHVPKKGKSVILLSSMHRSEKEDDKPEHVLSYYNATKSGVKNLDGKCAAYSCSRRTRRWSMAVFFKIIDMSAVNAHIIHQSYVENRQSTRVDFMRTLAKQLVTPYMETRMTNPNLPRELRTTIQRILGVTIEMRDVDLDKLPREERKICFVCPAKKRRKTCYLCCNCKRPVCLECSRKICLNCTMVDEDL